MKDVLVDIKLKELVLSIMRLQNINFADASESEKNKYTNHRFKAVIDYIKQNITSTIHIAELSRIAYMSKSVFYRTFNNEFGLPPARMILNEKIKHAKTLMATENARIKEVCFALGFSDPNYFSRAFKKVEGLTPGQYIDHLKNSAEN
jgi:AraC-like DNA-binding protein